MKRNTGMIGLIAAVLVVFAAAPAIAEPTMPFVVGGNVSDAGTPCNGSYVRITNTNTSVGWDAVNSSESKYYQLVITSDDVNPGDVLRFAVTYVGESAEVKRNVTQDEVNAGGFGLDILFGGTPGDVNGDGEVTTVDAVIVLRMVVRGEFSEEADMSGDRAVTSLDALMILQQSQRCL